LLIIGCKLQIGSNSCKEVYNIVVYNNLMKLGGSRGNVPTKNEKLVIKTQYISDC
jgi:hypothetical protein